MTGDEEGYREFVAARYSALRRTAYVLTGNHHDAEDLVQTALMKAGGAWGRIHEDLSETQVAAAMGVRVGTVKSQTRHALMRLRELAPELAPEFVGELSRVEA
ncbi:MAG TPA: sigma factor [Nocardioidaceae bacterium]|nr:sigma factor [Nocardioidaceae bacterium]